MYYYEHKVDLHAGPVPRPCYDVYKQSGDVFICRVYDQDAAERLLTHLNRDL